MSDIAIRVEGLGKRYRRGIPSGNDRLSEALSNLGRRLMQPARRLWRNNRDIPADPVPERGGEFWALEDVSFEVRSGEVVGIIGRNGAGKSTLLKILSRITEPTVGRFGVAGRVGSLLEVGTGFHSELTGRENIYLNGTMLGMSRREVQKRFDEIVELSGIGDFLDTPVKRYSSGMYVRLGFAVAAHLDSNILIVDEVLAVGDAEFQRKCLARIQGMPRSGRTVLLVSHNLASIKRLCSQALVLNDGKACPFDSVTEAIRHYDRILVGPMRQAENQNSIQILQEKFQSTIPCRLSSLEILDAREQPCTTIRTGDPVRFRIHYTFDEPLTDPGFRLRIFTEDWQELYRVSTLPISGYTVPPIARGPGFIDCLLPRFPFTGGGYLVSVSLTRPSIALIHDVEPAALIQVAPGDFYGSGICLSSQTCWLASPHEWRLGGNPSSSA